MTIPSLSLIVIRATNIEVALAFYRVIGLEFVQEQHDSGSVHYSCDLKGIVFEIYPRSNVSDELSVKDTTMIGFEVESLEKTIAELREAGFHPKGKIKASEWGRWINISDLNGRTVQLNEPARYNS